MIRKLAFCSLVVLFSIEALRPALAEGIYHMGTNNRQYLDSQTLLFVHVDKADDIIRLHLCRRQSLNSDITIRFFNTTLNAETGTYSADTHSAPLAEIQGRDNISCNDDMTSPLPATPTRGDQLQYQVSSAGVYAIDLSQNTFLNNQGDSIQVDFQRWDVSVIANESDTVDATEASGNLFSNKWSFDTGSYSRSASATTNMFILAPGGFANTNYVYALSLQEFSGFVYDVMANDIGLNAPYSGLSVSQDATNPAPIVDPLYPVYLNYPHGANPQPAPTGNPGLVDNFQFVNSDGQGNGISPNDDGIQDSGEFVFTADVSGTYAITIDLNQDGVYGTDDRLLLGTSRANELNRVTWDGKDANGNVVAQAAYDVQLELRVGEYHFVARDVETSGGGSNNDGSGARDGLTILQALSATNLVGTRVFWDDKTLLNGSSNLPDGVMSSTDATGSHRHTWGSFTATGFGNRTYIDTYVFGASSEFRFSSFVVVENGAPVAMDDTATVAEDSNDNLIDVLSNDTDADGDTLTITYVTADSGTVSINSDGTLSYTPLPNTNGTATITYTVSDGNGGSDTASVVVTITSDNDVPVIVDDTATVVEDSSNNTIDVLSNDTDADGDTLIITNVTTDSGTVSVNPDGTLNYTPAPNSTGVATITYTVSDGNGGSGTGTVTVNVTNVNDAPVIVDDTATIAEDSSNNTIDVLSNDTDADGDTLTITNVTTDSGTVSVNPDGTLNYTPAPNSTGVATITYTVSDGNGGSGTGTVTVNVTNVNDAPVAMDDVASVTENSSNNIIDVLSNDSDVDGDTLTIINAIVDSGTVSMNSDGTLSYTPEPNAFGAVTIIYSVSDGNGGTDNAMVQVTVNSVPNNPPTISGTPNISVLEGDTYSFVPTANDPDNEVLIFTIENQPSWASFDPDTGALSGVPMTDDIGTYTDIVICVQDSEDEVCLPAFTITVRGDDDDDGVPDDRDPDFGPLLTIPDDITVDAIALFTPVDIGQATAQDFVDGVLTDCCTPEARIENGSNLPIFSPGVTNVVWTAIDADGNVEAQIQKINVRPLISFGPDVSVAEGETASIPVYLNGLSPEYPLDITFSVTDEGTASLDDFNVPSNIITFTESTVAILSLDILADAESDSGETIVLELDDSVNRGEKFKITITISEDNLPPLVELNAVQDNTETLIIKPGLGDVVITANVTDPNMQDTHTFDWSRSDSNLVDTDSDNTTLTFDPSGLTPGFYRVIVSVTDDGQPQLSGEATIDIRVINDDDDVPEIVFDPCNIIPEIRGIDYEYIIEASAGNCLRVGPIGLASENGAAWLTVLDFENNDSLEPYTVNRMSSVGGRFDVQVHRMDRPGGVVDVVIPLRAPIPLDAGLLLYDVSNLTWFEFEALDNERVASAPGEAGFCPPPGDASYQPGLNDGDYCLQMTIQDGGVNDLDDEANGLIETISGVHVLNDDPNAVDDSSVVNQGSVDNILNVLANDSDNDGDTLSIAQVNILSDIGTVTMNDDGTLNFTPDPEFNGDAVISYIVSDGNGGTDTASVNVQVLPRVRFSSDGGGAFEWYWLLMLGGIGLVVCCRRIKD